MLANRGQKWVLGIGAVSVGLLCWLGGCASNGAESLEIVKQDLLGLPGDMLEDSRELVTSGENVAVLLLAGGASGYVRCDQDDGIAGHFEGHHTFGRDFTIAQGVIGTPVTHFALAGAGYIYGLAAEREHTREVALSAIEALSLTGLITVTGKVIAQDHSPNGESLAWPSGHTSSTVAAATLMHEYYGPWVGLPLYALSGFVMYERMETGEHWASDIVFGAAIGYTVARTVADRYRPELFGMDVLPYIDPETGQTGIALAKQF